MLDKVPPYIPPYDYAALMIFLFAIVIACALILFQHAAIGGAFYFAVSLWVVVRLARHPRPWLGQ